MDEDRIAELRLACSQVFWQDDDDADLRLKRLAWVEDCILKAMPVESSQPGQVPAIVWQCPTCRTGHSDNWNECQVCKGPRPERVPDTDAVCTACRYRFAHAADCPRKDEPWPTIERVPASDALERVTRAIDDDLYRQAHVQRGVTYYRADEAGVAVASLNIVVAEVARAVLAALNGGPSRG